MYSQAHIGNASIAVNGIREPSPRAMHVQPADVVGPNEWRCVGVGLRLKMQYEALEPSLP